MYCLPDINVGSVRHVQHSWVQIEAIPMHPRSRGRGRGRYWLLLSLLLLLLLLLLQVNARAHAASADGGDTALHDVRSFSQPFFAFNF